MRIGSPRRLWPAFYMLPLAWAVWAILEFGVDVPYRENRAFTAMIHSAYVEHVVHWKGLLHPYGPHQAVFFKLAMIFMVFATGGWKIRYELLISPVLAAANCWALYELSKRTHPDEEIGPAGLVMCTLVFSLAQLEIWLHSVTFHFHMCHLAFLAAVLALSNERRTWKHFIFAATLCFVATLTSAQGLASWIALLPLLLVSNGGEAGTPVGSRLWLWGGALSPALALYFFPGFTLPQDTDPLYGLTHPLQALGYGATLLGAPLAGGDARSAPWAGGATVLFYICTRPRKAGRDPVPIRTAAPWHCVFLFSALSVLMISLNRLRTEEAMVSRYIPVSTLALVAVLYLALVKFPRQGMIPKILQAGLFCASLWSSVRALPRYKSLHAQLTQGKACLETYSIASPYCLGKLADNSPKMVPTILLAAPMMIEAGAVTPFTMPRDAVFSSKPGAPRGAWTSLEPRRYQGEAMVTASGWAMLDGCRRVDHVLLTYGRERRWLAHTAAAFGADGAAAAAGGCARDAGWSVEIDTAAWAGARLNPPAEAWVWDERTKEFISLGASPL